MSIKNFSTFYFYGVFPSVLELWFGATDLKCTHDTTALKRFVEHVMCISNLT